MPPAPALSLVHAIDDFDLVRFLPVAAGFGQERYGFVVTPNVDHLIRLHDDPAFQRHYAAAAYILFDSRFAARLLRLIRGIDIPVCTGADLTAALFSQTIRPRDRIVLIGGRPEQASLLAARYGLGDLRHHDPPMGFIRDGAAVEGCLRFIEAASPFRFCFLAVGSPQQEALASELGTRGIARGLALCIGASLNFLTGTERRAPVWMQRVGVEWLYRLGRDPRRLAQRYLVRGPRIFGQLFRDDFLLRSPGTVA